MTIQKVAAYIIRPHTEGPHLLAFRERDFPELALQPPGGTVDPGEALEMAVRREVAEESGLTDLHLVGKIGEDPFHWEGLPHVRHFYLFQAPVDLPDTWDHVVTGAGEDAGIVYSYEWLPPDRYHLLHRGFRVFLDQLAQVF